MFECVERLNDVSLQHEDEQLCDSFQIDFLDRRKHGDEGGIK